MVFKKGEITNPKGRPKTPDDIAFAKELNKAFVEVKIGELLRKSINELEVLLRDKDKESIDHFIGRIIINGIVTGDHRRLNFLFDRIIGKVTEKVDVQLPAPFLVESIDGETIECGMKMEEEK